MTVWAKARCRNPNGGTRHPGKCCCSYCEGYEDGAEAGLPADVRMLLSEIVRDVDDVGTIDWVTTLRDEAVHLLTRYAPAPEATCSHPPTAWVSKADGERTRCRDCGAWREPGDVPPRTVSPDETIADRACVRVGKWPEWPALGSEGATPRGDERLVWGAVHNAGRVGDSRPRWAAVSCAIGVGSTSARELCRRFGLDPDETVGQPPEERTDPADPAAGEDGGSCEE